MGLMTRSHRRRVSLVAGLCAATMMVGACSSDGTLPDVSLPDVSLPDVELPDVTLPDIGGGDAGDAGDAGDSGDSGSAPAGGQDAAAPASDAADPDDGIDVGVLLALLALALAAVAIAAAMGRDSRSERGSRQRSMVRQIGSLVEVAHWADGQTGQLLDLDDPRRAKNATATVTSRIADAEAEAARLASGVDSRDLTEALEDLGGRFAALRGSITRLIAADPSTVEAARQATTTRREQLNVAVHTVSALTNADTVG